MNRISIIAFAALLFAGLPACTEKNDSAPSVTAGSGASAAPVIADPTSAPQAPKIEPLDVIPAWADSASVNDAVACYADSLNGEGGAAEGAHRTVSAEQGFSLMGWAIDKSMASGVKAPPVLIKLKPVAQGESYAFQAMRHDRPDVSAAAEFAALRPADAGVLLDANIQTVAPGMYQLQYVVNEGADAKLCDMGAPWQIEVRVD